MRADARALAAALRTAIAVDEFIVWETRAVCVAKTLAGSQRSTQSERKHVLGGRLFVDRKQGRGEADLRISPEEPVSPQVKEASTRAFGAIGPAWRLPPPSAPSRVTVRDPDDPGRPEEVAQLLKSEFYRELGRSASASQVRISAQYATHRSILSTGFRGQYSSANHTVTATLQEPGGVPARLRIEVRRLADFAAIAKERIHWARSQSSQGARATAPTPARLDVAIELGAFVPRHADDFGIWTPLVREAQAKRVREGISSHALGQPIIRAPKGDRLSLRSEGNVDYALRSAPFADDGQAVRTIEIADKGIAAGLAVDHRESALGAGPANGGVRRLVIGAGSRSSEELGRPELRPLLLVQSLASIHTGRDGSLLLEIAQGELRRRDARGATTRTPIRGGFLAGRLKTWMEAMWLSKETGEGHGFHGPQRIRIEDVVVQ